MDYTKLKRNPSYVHAALKANPDGTVIALKKCEICIPSRFTDANLAMIGNVVEFVSIYAIMVDGNYGISTTNALVRSKPSETRTEKIDDVEYLFFTYEKGDTVFLSSEVVKIDTVVYYIWTELLDKGKECWYLEPDDLAGLMITAKTHGNANLGSYAILEMIVSVCLRNAKKRKEVFRYAINRDKNAKAVQIGLRNIQFTADTDLAKVGGSYSEIGLASGMVEDRRQAEGLEQILLL